MAEFCIGKADSEFLKVQILYRSHTAGDYWDGNWVDAKIEISAGGFRGRFGAYLRSEELRAFHEALSRLYAFEAREADFETMEEQLSIKVRGDGLGHFEAVCVAADMAGRGNRLSFSLSFDQTEIPAIISGLNSVMKAFPVVGRADE